MKHTASFIERILRCVLDGSFFMDGIDTKLRNVSICARVEEIINTYCSSSEFETFHLFQGHFGVFGSLIPTTG